MKESSAVSQRIADCEGLLTQLQSFYGKLPAECLWETHNYQTLIVPRIGCIGDSLSNGFTYIGRSQAKPLYELVCQLRRGNVLLIKGAKGSGKSTVMSAMVGFLLAKRKRRAVYFSASEFCNNPAAVLRDALLVATRSDAEIADLTTMEELELWCEIQRTVSDEERLLFVVDDWDTFENYPREESLLMGIVRYHILVKLSSSNSRDRQLTNTSDKPLPDFDFDGPYSQEELLTWISQSKLPAGKLEDLDCLTGGMPRLLKFYEEAGGSAKRFREAIDERYTQKLYTKLVQRQTCSMQLGALLQLVTTGVRGAALARPFDFTCFYKDQRKLVPLSPYLRSRLEFYIMEHSAALEVALQLRDLKGWSDAVRLDCVSRGRNPARVGWNVEGLVIAVMRYQGKLWGDLDFKHVKTYEHGWEADLLASLTDEELREGVLVVPLAFNEEALDVIYLRLTENVLEVKPVQITVSVWKHKKKKRSHIVWQSKVLRRWLAEDFAVKHQFVYLMPDTLTREELGEVHSDLRTYLAMCRAASPGEVDVEEEDLSEVYDEESTSLDNVESEDLLFKKFGDVHVCLREFDRRLRLPQPSQALKKEPKQQCAGYVVDEDGSSRPCKRWCRTGEASWFCCAAHQNQSVVHATTSGSGTLSSSSLLAA